LFKKREQPKIHLVLSMRIPSDEVVQIRHADAAGDPTVVTVSCPDQTGLGCDLCRLVLLFGLNILKGGASACHAPLAALISAKIPVYFFGWLKTSALCVADMSTDGRWCYIVLWVVARQRRAMAWDLLKERLVELCPVPAPFGIDSSFLAAAGLLEDLAPAAPQVFLLKLCCYDRVGLLHGTRFQFATFCFIRITRIINSLSLAAATKVLDPSYLCRCHFRTSA
jgi:hypothetical protein